MDGMRIVATWKGLSSYFHCSAMGPELPKEQETRRRPKSMQLDY